jgi:galactokinase/mevalonate kinase-like predicted kinase
MPIETEKNEAITTIEALVHGAEGGAKILKKVHQSEFSIDNDAKVDKINSCDIDNLIDDIGDNLDSYWELKKEMAEGSEPYDISRLFAYIRHLTVGLSLCGAGAGGFAVVILKKENYREDLSHLLSSFNSDDVNCNNELKIHSVSIDTKGLSIDEYHDNNEKVRITEYLFR